MQNITQNHLSSIVLLILLTLSLMFIASELVFTEVHQHPNAAADDFCHLISNTIQKNQNTSQELIATVTQSCGEIIVMIPENTPQISASNHQPVQEKSRLFFLATLLI